MLESRLIVRYQCQFVDVVRCVAFREEKCRRNLLGKGNAGIKPQSKVSRAVCDVVSSVVSIEV